MMMRIKKIFALALVVFILGACSHDNKATTYTVTWKNWDGSVLEVDTGLEIGTLPSYDGNTPTRPSDGRYIYTFSKWDPELTRVTRDVEYTATYSANRITYTLDFDLDGGTSYSYNGPKTVYSFSTSIFFFDVVKEGYTFRGWSFNGTKIIDEKENLLEEPVMQKEMTFKAVYSQTSFVTVTCNYQEAAAITGEGEYPYNSFVDLYVDVNDGYEFIGWYKNNSLVSNSPYYQFILRTEDVCFEARFSLRTYSLIVAVHDCVKEYGRILLDSDDVQSARNSYEVNKQYKTTMSVAAVSMTSDVPFYCWIGQTQYDTSSVKIVSKNQIIDFTMPASDYYLYALWDRFEINYELNGGVNNESNPTFYTTNSGTLHLNEPTKNGSSFLNWKLSGTKVVDNNIVMFEEQNVETIDCSQFLLDLSLTAIWDEPQEVRYATKPIISDDGKTIKYGLYPQTVVNNIQLISSLNALSAPTSNGWYFYEDYYYAKDVAPQKTYNNKFDNGKTILGGETYWFRCEPIVWNILNNDNGKCFVVSGVLLDEHYYYYSTSTRTIDGQTVYPNNYEHSHIRGWLNKDFYNSAFALNDTYIQTTIVDNSAATTASEDNQYACSNTEDKVFLLSYQDYINDSYGFLTSTNASDTRICKTTDWIRVKCNAIYTKNYNGLYWTRSPYSTSIGSAYDIASSGGFSADDVTLERNIRPAITIRID